MGLKVRKTPKAKIESEIAHAAKLLDIEHLLDRKPKALSGGQRQRVAMGRAIVRRPKVFMFDEPLSNLDAALRAQMRTEIARLHAKLGITTVYVTHDQVEAMTLADRIVILHKGVLQQIGGAFGGLFKAQYRLRWFFFGITANESYQGKITSGPSFKMQAGRLELADRYKSHLGQEVFAGIRPQNISLSDSGALQGTVELVEPLGGESIVRVRLKDGQKLTVQMNGTTTPHKK